MRIRKEDKTTVVKNDWFSLYLRPSLGQFTVDKAGYFDERPQVNFNASQILLMLMLPFLGLPIWVSLLIGLLSFIVGYGKVYLHLPIKTGIDDCESPEWGFYLYGHYSKWYRFDSLVICYGDDKRKYIYMPWTREWFRTSLLMKDCTTWENETKGNRDKSFWDDKWHETAFREVHPYAYTLKDGTVQSVNAAIMVKQMEHRPRWFMWTSLFSRVSTYIDINFSDEVGEHAGSWKGGVVGCSYDMIKGETPLDTLKRMEKERKF